MPKEELKPPGSSGTIAVPNVLGWISGLKTYIAGIGLIALGVYQITQGDIQAGVETIAAGLAVIGIGHKIEKSKG